MRGTFIALKPDTERRRTILELFGAGSFIPAKASDYDAVANIGRQLGKIR